ncbi:MAG: carboxymuconolactone decarboxylase family protein [Bradyrhizobium sp.]|nr:carboxymuconolactone decarboxylase family protein [Bradyrhizobium sp.]
MGRLRQVPESEAKGKTAELYEGIKAKLGRVPNVHQAMGVNPAFLGSMLQLSAAAGKGLDMKTKELINIAVSSVNNCRYCLDAHVAIAKKHGVTDAEIHAAVECAAAMSAFNVFNHGADPEIDF